jgi:hypothetical protein
MKTNITERLCEEFAGNSASRPRDFGPVNTDLNFGLS